MNFSPIKIITKSKKEIVIREVVSEDAHNLIDLIKNYMSTGHILLTKDEFNPTIREQENWIQQFKKNPINLFLVAEHKDQIIGNIDLTNNKRNLLKHTGYIGMGVHTKWHNLGVGAALLKTLIDWTKSHSEIELLWLQVFGNNKPAIHLYKKFGFVEDGRQSRFIKTLDGNYVDNVIMTKSLMSH